MKKLLNIHKLILLILFLSTISNAQTIKPTNVIITNNNISTTAPYITVQESTGTLNKINKTDLYQVLEYSTASNLPVTGVSKKIYITTDNNKLYRWTGTIYQEVAVTDISEKENISNKQNSLAADGTGTKYATIDAVIAGLNAIPAPVSPTLQQVLDEGTMAVNGTSSVGILNLDGTLGNYFSINDVPNKSTLISQGATGITLRGTTSNGQGSIGILEGNVILESYNAGTDKSTGVNFTIPISDTNLLLPAKPLDGDYTLATLDDIPSPVDISGKANIASPTFTGTPTAPTATAGTNTTQIATTAFVLANSNANGILEYNTIDKTIWNNGKSNILENTSFGDLSLISNTTGTQNTGNGYGSLNSTTTGTGNSAFGFYSLFNNPTGSGNTAIGTLALFQTGGSNNTALGISAGRYAGAGTVLNSVSNNSTFIGNHSRSLAINQTNEIVVGDDALGNGSNTVTLGNNAIIKTVLKGLVTAPLTTNALITADASGKALVTKEYLSSTSTGGTVTSVTGTNGVTVSTGTTTPVIGLGAITPTSVASSGTVSGTSATFSSSVTTLNLGLGTTPNLVYPLSLQSTSGGNGIRIIGRSDNLGYLEFCNNNGTTVNSSINGSTNGLQFTGASTFSSGVTATSFNSTGASNFATSGGNVRVGADIGTPSTLSVGGTFRSVLQSLSGGQNIIGAIGGISNGFIQNIGADNSISYGFYNGSNVKSLSIDNNNSATFSSSVTATAHVTTGGTASQFVKGDGSLSSTSYLPLTGGTLSGALVGASANFSGTFTVAEPINPSNAATKNYVDTSLSTYKPYKVYTALLNQTGTGVPIATVLENTLGTITFGYTTAGQYTINSSGLFTINKTSRNAANTGSMSTGFSTTISTSLINLFTSSNGTYSNDGLIDTYIEIRVYN